jgi:hypothetical protein
MKRILCSLALLIVGTAFAGTATAEKFDLYTTGGWGCLHQYHNADTSLAGVTATLYLPQAGSGYGSLSISDSTGYYTGPYAGSGLMSVLTDNTTGATVLLTITETFYRKQINSGRTHMWCTHWTLQSGTIIR